MNVNPRRPFVATVEDRPGHAPGVWIDFHERVEPIRLTDEEFADAFVPADEVDRLIEAARADAERLYQASAIFDRVDDHTYCHDDQVDGCVVTPLREARRAHAELTGDNPG